MDGLGLPIADLSPHGKVSKRDPREALYGHALLELLRGCGGLLGDAHRLGKLSLKGCHLPRSPLGLLCPCSLCVLAGARLRYHLSLRTVQVGS